LHCSVGIWVGVLCHLLKFVVPSFNAVLLYIMFYYQFADEHHC
jgi:chromate transport protein ChrA